MADLGALVRDLWGRDFRISRWYIPGHDGIDLPAKQGTPVRAVASGTVSYARDARTDSAAGKAWAIGGGRTVNIDIGDSLTTQYAHLDTIRVRPGQVVRKGDIIGTVGATGGTPNSPGASFGSSNSHLHFGLWNRKSNRMVDPTDFLLRARAGWNSNDGIGDDAAVKLLTKLGVPTDRNHTITEAEARKIADQYNVSGSVYDAIVRSFTGMKVGTYLDRYSTGTVTQTDLVTGEQGVINQAGDVLGTITDPGVWVRILGLGVGLVIAGYGFVNVLRANGAAPRVGV